MSREPSGERHDETDDTHPSEPGVVHRLTDGQSDETKTVIAELAQTLASRFELVKRIGAGGMGLVVLARDPLLNRNVAIKVLAPHLAHDAGHRERFIREAQAAAAVSHPNIVAIHLVGELPRSRVPYFVMQHIEGKTLDEAFTKGGAAETDATRILGDVAFALAAAHERGIVHRDVKPSNIMIEAATDRVIVLDFGISAFATAVTSGGTTGVAGAGNYLGTPRYMSPEQASGTAPITAKCDSYSLGCVACEMLTGKPPFEGNSPLVLMAAHMGEPPPDIRALRPDLSPRFARLIARCLQKEPNARPSADEVRRTLAPPATLLAWPPRAAIPMRDAMLRGMRWLNVSAGLLLLDYAARLLMSVSAPIRAVFEAPPVATTLLALALAAALLAAGELVVAVRRGARLGRLGFSAWPLLDIVGDHDGHTGELILGQRRFAALTPEEQRAVGSARVMRGAARYLVVPTAALTSLLVQRLQAAGALLVLVVSVAWLVEWARAVQLERRLTGNRSIRGGRSRAAREYRLTQQWLDRYWSAWRGVDRERAATTVAIAQRVVVGAIVLGTLLAAVIVALRRLFTGG